MTQTQRKQLTRAFQIAARDALRATRGTRRDGQPVCAVRSRSETARAGYAVYWLLTVQDDQIVCTCAAHRSGRICALRAAIRAERAADARWYRSALMHDYPALAFKDSPPHLDPPPSPMAGPCPSGCCA